MRIRLFLLVAFTLSFMNANADMIKSWKFNRPHGTLEIFLLTSPDGSYSLGMAPLSQGPAAPVAEQVEPLKQVLSELPKLGVQPGKLTYLGTRLFEEDAIEKLAYACVDSPECRTLMQKGGKERNDVLVKLLNKYGVFEPYNEAFEQYGIRLRVTKAEKVFVMRFSRVRARNPRDRANAGALVPSDAMLGMRFSPIDRK